MNFFCPRCGAELDEARDFVQPYTVADSRVFNLWCSRCGVIADISFVDRVIAYELEH